MKYRKFTYWLTKNEFMSLDKALIERDISMRETKRAVCLPLSMNVEIGYVPPDTWHKYNMCKRQLSWYGVSRYAGRYLVVSSFSLDEYGLTPATIVRQTKFRPKVLPKTGKGERERLINKPGYQKAKPSVWEDIESEDKESLTRWLKIMGIRGETFEEIFITHCANHANFIEPEYFIEEDDEKVPYSIAKTNRICSACLEFFNILGADFKKKLVVPCPGAVLFAGMGVNRYYEVISI